jgi:hypothetical protein
MLARDHEQPGRSPALGSAAGLGDAPRLAREGLSKISVLLAGIEPQGDQRESTPKFTLSTGSLSGILSIHDEQH